MSDPPPQLPQRFRHGIELQTRYPRPVTLRTLGASDGRAFALHVSSDLERLGEFLPWPAVTADEEGAHDWLDAYEQMRDGRVVVLGMWDEDRLLGGALLFHHDPANAVIEIGCWIVADGARNGITAAACRVLLRYARRDLRAERVEWHAASGNEASRMLAEHLGFRHEGTMRSSFVLRGERLDIDIFSLVGAELDDALQPADAG